MNRRDQVSQNAHPVVAFLCGALAALVVYCVFAVRHFDAVMKHIRSYDQDGHVVMAVCLGVILLVSGLLTAMQKPRSGGSAFTKGLAIPAILFAADITGPVTETAVAAPEQVRTTQDRGPLSALRLLTAPVSTVARIQRQDVEKEVVELEKKQETMLEEVRVAREQKDALDGELRTLREDRARMQQELTEYKAGRSGEIDDLKSRIATFKEDQQRWEDERSGLEASIAGLKTEVSKLNAEIQELKDSTGGTSQKLRHALAEIARLKSEKDELEGQLNAANETITSLKADASQLTRERDELKREITRLGRNRDAAEIQQKFLLGYKATEGELRGLLNKLETAEDQIHAEAYLHLLNLGLSRKRWDGIYALAREVLVVVNGLPDRYPESAEIGDRVPRTRDLLSKPPR